MKNKPGMLVTLLVNVWTIKKLTVKPQRAITFESKA